MNQNVYIVSAARTPIGVFGGSLKSISATDLAIHVIQSVVQKAGIETSAVDAVFFGNCFDPLANNIARIAAVKAGLPLHTSGVSISSTCGSGMQAVASAFRSIRDGESDVVIAGGVESMSNAPYVSNTSRWGQRLRHTELFDLIWKAMQEYPLGAGMGVTAENIAARDNISREDQDQLAFTSQQRALAAIKSGTFREEIAPVKIPQRKGDPIVVDTDEHPREVSMDQLAKLQPAFKERGCVTAGNSSGINDGAASMALMSQAGLDQTGAKPLARILDTTVVGVDPDYMGDGPVPATRKLLQRTRLSLGDIGLIEINEAFAAQYLACERALGLDREITNVNGSGIALGHPVGCTGCRIMVTLLHEMGRRKAGIGLAALCAGGGQGFATLLERL